MDELLFLGNLDTGGIAIIAIVVLLLFDDKKVPELMRGIGKGVKNFRDGVKGLKDDIKLDDTEKEQRKVQQEEMSFWDHLEELRWTLFCSILALFVFAIAGFPVMPWLFNDVMMAPCSPDFIVYQKICKTSSHFSSLPNFYNDTFHVSIVNIRLAFRFFTHMTSSFWSVLSPTPPYLIQEIWKFVSPALYKNEEKNIRQVLLFGAIMLFIGCLVGYFLVFPMTLRFSAIYELSAAITEQVSLNSYTDNLLMLIFVMGIVSEMLLVSWLLSQIGLLDCLFFHRYRRHAAVDLLVGATFTTPSNDPFTLSIVFLPFYGLYELSTFFVKKTPEEEGEESEEDSNEE